jgi:hypothetical protein
MAQTVARAGLLVPDAVAFAEAFDGDDGVAHWQMEDGRWKIGSPRPAKRDDLNARVRWLNPISSF